MIEYTKEQIEMQEKFAREQAEQRRLFFKALGIEDDGRLNPNMTEEEFKEFGKPVQDYFLADLKGKTVVGIYGKFEAYYDVAYDYCFEDDTVYERRFYVGD